MRKIWKKVVSVLLALAMVVLALPEYVSPVKEAKAAEGTRKIYELTTFLTDDNNYLIVSARTPGAAYALSHTEITPGRELVTIHSADDMNGAEAPFIYADDPEAVVPATAVWTTATEGESDLMRIKNGNYYLQIYGRSGSSTLEITNGPLDEEDGAAYSKFNWRYGIPDNSGATQDHLYVTYSSNHDSVRYLQYARNSFSGTNQAGNANVYIFVEKEVCVNHNPKFDGFEWHDHWVIGEQIVTAEALYTCSSCGKSVKLEASVSKTGETEADCTSRPKNQYAATISASDSLDGSAHSDNYSSVQLTEDTSISTVEDIVYVLTDTLTPGKKYLLVNANSEGQAHALANGFPLTVGSDVTVRDRAVTIQNAAITIGDPSSSELIIKVAPEDAVWKYTEGTGTNKGYFQNGEYYLFHYTSNNNTSYTYVSKTGESGYRVWDIHNGNTLRYHSNGNNYYYAMYTVSNQNPWRVLNRRTVNQAAPGHVYFFEETTVQMYGFKEVEGGTHQFPLTAVTAVEPTCEEDGNIAYWKCERCGKLFLDADGSKETTAEAVVLKAAHDWQFDHFDWNQEGKLGYTSATAVYKCSRESTHTITVIAPTVTDTELDKTVGTDADTFKAYIAAGDSPDGLDHEGTEDLAKYTVSFLLSDDSPLTETVYYVGTPALEITVPDGPSREPDFSYTYTFAGWKDGDNEVGIHKVEGPAVYKPTYTTEDVLYTVTWNVEGTETVETDHYKHGDTPVYPGAEDPSKASTPEYEYTWTGWTDGENLYAPGTELPAIDATDKIFKAAFTEGKRSYTVTFVVEGETAQTGLVEYGSKPVYAGETPSKPNEGNTVYTFDGWMLVGGDNVYAPGDELPAVDEKGATYTAVFGVKTYYDINIDDAVNGTIRTDKADNKAQANDTVVLTLEPAEGYDLYDYSVTGPDGAITVTESADGRTFQMPAGDVSVHATFVKFYPVWIAGEQISTLNASDVLGDGAGSERMTFEVKDGKFILHVLTGSDITLNPDIDDMLPQLQSALISVHTGVEDYTPELVIDAPEGLSLVSSTALVGIYNQTGCITVDGDVSIKLSHTNKGSDSHGFWCDSFDNEKNTITVNGDVTIVLPDTDSNNWRQGEGFTSSGKLVVTGDVTVTGSAVNAISVGTVDVKGNVTIDGCFYTGIYVGDSLNIGKDANVTAAVYGINCAEGVKDVNISGNLSISLDPDNGVYGVAANNAKVTVGGDVSFGTLTISSDGIRAKTISIGGSVFFDEAEADFLLTTAHGNITIVGSVKGKSLDGQLIFAGDGSVHIEGDVIGSEEDTPLAVTGNGIFAEAGIVVDGDINMEITGIETEALKVENGGITVGGIVRLKAFSHGIIANGGEISLKKSVYLEYGEENSADVTKKNFGIFSKFNKVIMTEGVWNVRSEDLNDTAISSETGIVIPNTHSISVPENGEISDQYDIIDAEGNISASARIEPAISITFVDEDGSSVLDKDTSFVGKQPVYDQEKPKKESSTEKDYPFIGWSDGETTYAPDELPVLTDDSPLTLTYTAVYGEVARKYTVTFVGEDGELVLLEGASYEYGTKASDITKPGDFSKEPTAEFTYELSWVNKDTNEAGIKDVTGDATYKATFTAVPRKYTIKFVNEDGSELQSGEVGYGTKPEYTGTTPTKEETAQYRYVFEGWTPEIAAVNGEATYKAKFAEKTKSYTIKFVNEDGTELQSSAVDYGKTPEYTGATPTKAADSQYTYTFKSWTPEIAAVTGAATYKATYDKKEITSDDPIEEKGVYQYIGDANVSYKLKSGAVVKMQFKRTTNDEITFDRFKSARDSKRVLVLGTDYKASKGSVIVELLPEYLDTLSVGKSVITVSFEDGDDVSVELEILPADAEEQKESPKTADSMVFAWIIFLIGVASFAFVLIAKKRDEEARVGL